MYHVFMTDNCCIKPRPPVNQIILISVWLIVSEVYYYHCVIKFNKLRLCLYEMMGYQFIILVCSIVVLPVEIPM